MLTEQRLNEITHQIIKVAIDVHRDLGPGLLEKVYQTCLKIALEDAEYRVEAEVPLPIIFRGRQISVEGYRMDLLVDDIVIIEIKSVSELIPIFSKQLSTYLRLSEKPCGLILNFNSLKLTDGIKRMKNGYLPQR